MTKLPPICRCLIAAALIALCARWASAAGGIAITLPQPGTKVKSGLAMTIDMRGVEANGYRPVVVTVKPLNGLPLPADRQLRVVLTPHANMSQLSPEVTQVIELPEGSTVVTDTIAIPQTGQWWSFSIETFEDGEKLRDLSMVNAGIGGMNYWEWTEARPATLIIDRNVPDRATRDKIFADFKQKGTDTNPTFNLPEPRMFTNLFPDPNRNNSFYAGNPKLSDAALLDNLFTNYPRLELLPPTEVPKRWIALSQYDLIMISRADLNALAKSEPERLAALSDWASSGPVLLVYGVGNDFDGLAEVERLLKLPPMTGQSGNDEFRGWIPAPNERHHRNLIAHMEDFDEASLMQMRPNYGNRYINPVPPPSDPSYSRGKKPALLPQPATPPFAMRPMGLGIVVGVASDNPFPGQDTDWIWIMNSVPRSHWMWYQRNGFSLHRQNSDYWTFLIPGVGEAPVVSFLLLVSLFAVVIGPVNYMLLGKTGRYYLLLITVPVGALLVTGGLFTYAIVTDGLGIKLRARTFTDLDQRNGRAVACSRQSYYASIAPSRGLSFPGDATVFPILYEPGQRPGAGNEPDNHLEWDEDQHLTRGYITSRTNTQFMVLRVTESQDKLAVVEGKASGRPPQITNQLRTDITYLLLRDGRGEFWQAKNLADGQNTQLMTVSLSDATGQLKKLYGANPPEMPEGYDPMLHNTAFSMFMPNYGWYGVDASSMLPVMASGLLEKNLALATVPGELGEGSYIAITKSSPAAPGGVPRVREEASLHMIRGKY